MNWLMLSCRKASELVEKKLHFGLSSKEKFQLFLHLSMCDACKAYQKQTILLDKLLTKQSDSQNVKSTIEKPLPEEVKSKIINELEKL